MSRSRDVAMYKVCHRDQALKDIKFLEAEELDMTEEAVTIKEGVARIRHPIKEYLMRLKDNKAQAVWWGVTLLRALDGRRGQPRPTTRWRAGQPPGTLPGQPPRWRLGPPSSPLAPLEPPRPTRVSPV